MAGGQSFSNSRTLAQIPDDAALRRTRRRRVWGKTKPTAFTHGPTALLFVGRARRTSGQGEPDRGQHRQAAGVGAPKVIGVLVPMSAFGGKADMSSGTRERAAYFIPTTIESGPTKCSTWVLRNPISFIQPAQSAPV